MRSRPAIGSRAFDAEPPIRDMKPGRPATPFAGDADDEVASMDVVKRKRKRQDDLIAAPKPSRVFADVKARLPEYAFEIILDVGANIGQSAVSYALHAPEAAIHSFEPIAATFGKLQANTASYPNVTAHNLALGERPETLRALADGVSVRNRIVSEEAAGAAYQDVQVTSGNAFCAERGISRVSFLKIDTEGHDMAVLRGFGDALGMVDFVQVEASLNPQNALHVPLRVLEDHIRSFGFLLFKIYDQVFEFHSGGRPYARRGNIVFINEKLVAPLP